VDVNEIRAPKKRRRVGIKWKMFIILFLFVFTFAFCIWIFEVQMLHYFYQAAKFKELESVSESLSASLGDDIEIMQITDDYADEYYSDIWVYQVEGNNFDKAYKITYEEGLKDSLGYYVEPNFSDIYESATKNGGRYVALVPMDNFRDSYFQFKIIKDNMGEPRTFPFILGNMRELNAVFVEIFEVDGAEYVIFQRTNITPLGTMISTLENQVVFIGTLLIIFTLILAAVMAKVITKPLEQVTEAAKSLAAGKYNTEFKGHGYREIDELSDTLNYAANELSRNDHLQKELLSNVSHDLRTPLTMIKGYSEVMRDIPEENTPENVQVIIDETARLTDLVNDMLDLSKIQSGARLAEMREFCLTEVVRDTMFRYEKLTMQDGYKIEFRADRDVYVVADSTMILQVVYNLINNAINYTGEDKYVSVTQSVEGDTVRISVSDTGEGISEEQIPLIWERYYKIDKVHRRATVGTGLGLSIVKGILEIHNATYGVSSTLGKGSTFWFELKTADSQEYKAEIIDI
jgi:signal transduction histidine kinase